MYLKSIFQKYQSQELPKAFGNMWTSNRERRRGLNEGQIQVRNNEDFCVPAVRTSTTQRMLLSDFRRTWNELEDRQLKKKNYSDNL
jgi:hypothetical protein